MLAVLLFLLFASMMWLSGVIFVAWRLLREQDCGSDRNLSVSQLLVQGTQRRRLWCSFKAWLATKPLRLTHQPVRVCLPRCQQAVRRKRLRTRRAS